MLQNIPLFSCLNDHNLKQLEKVMVKKVYSKNAIVFSEGDESDGLYVIIRGKVKAVIIDENGKEIILNTHGPGEYFGEMADPGLQRLLQKRRQNFELLQETVLELRLH